LTPPNCLSKCGFLLRYSLLNSFAIRLYSSINSNISLTRQPEPRAIHITRDSFMSFGFELSNTETLTIKGWNVKIYYILFHWEHKYCMHKVGIFNNQFIIYAYLHFHLSLNLSLSCITRLSFAELFFLMALCYWRRTKSRKHGNKLHIWTKNQSNKTAAPVGY